MPRDRGGPLRGPKSMEGGGPGVLPGPAARHRRRHQQLVPGHGSMSSSASPGSGGAPRDGQGGGVVPVDLDVPGGDLESGRGGQPVLPGARSAFGR